MAEAICHLQDPSCGSPRRPIPHSPTQRPGANSSLVSIQMSSPSWGIGSLHCHPQYLKDKTSDMVPKLVSGEHGLWTEVVVPLAARLRG